MPLTREELVNNTQIIFSESNNNKLSITEALLIRKMQPSINTKSTGISRTLKTFHLTCPLPTVPDPNLKSNIKFIYPSLNYHANCTPVTFYTNYQHFVHPLPSYNYKAECTYKILLSLIITPTVP